MGPSHTINQLITCFLGTPDDRDLLMEVILSPNHEASRYGRYHLLVAMGIAAANLMCIEGLKAPV